MTVEPGIHFPGWGRAWIKEQVPITGGGYEGLMVATKLKEI